MLAELCGELRNWFCTENDKHFGIFEVKNGSLLSTAFLKDGQYFRIIGSTFNDGVFRFPVYGLIDEKFNGAIWAMSVPREVVTLSKEIKMYESQTRSNFAGFSSENYPNGYSYNLALGDNGAPLPWTKAFAPRIARWRKL